MNRLNPSMVSAEWIGKAVFLSTRRSSRIWLVRWALRWGLLATVLGVPFGVSGLFAQDAAIPEASRLAESKFNEGIAQARDLHSQAIEAARTELAGEFDTLIEKAREKGDLDAVVALTEDRDAARRGDSPGKSKSPAAIAARRAFDQTVRKADMAFKSAAEESHEDYLQQLDEIEKAETKAGRIESAKAIRVARQTIEKRGPPTLDTGGTKSGRGAGGDWIDLMEWTEGGDWLPGGVDWQSNLESPPTKNGLTTRQAEWSAFPLAAVISGEYELEIDLTSAKRETAITFPVDHHNPTFVLGAGEGAYDSFVTVNGRWVPDAETTRSPSRIRPGQRQKIRCRVTRLEDEWLVEVSVDEHGNWVKWSGPSSRLVQSTGHEPPSILGHVVLASFRSAATFHSARIRRISGSIQRAFRTDAEKKADLNRGEIRLVESPPFNVNIGWSKLGINQLPWANAYNQQTHWPLLARPFRFCSDYYGAHAPCRIQAEIPEGAESFSVIGTNEGSCESKFQILVDGKAIHETGMTAQAIIRVDLPAAARKLELLTDPAGDEAFDHTYWCYPRFHAVPASKIVDKALDDKPGKLKFEIAGATGTAVTHNRPALPVLRSPPVHFRDAVPCHEFFYCHAPSSLTFAIPRGMTRVTAVGYNVHTHSTRFEVWAGKQVLFRSQPGGIVPIDVRFPQGATEFTLRIDSLGDQNLDHSFWCYPRLHRR